MKLDKDTSAFIDGYNSALAEVEEYRAGTTKFIIKEEALSSISKRVPLNLFEGYEYAEFLLKGANEYSVNSLELAKNDNVICNLYRKNYIDADEFLEMITGGGEENETD